MGDHELVSNEGVADSDEAASLASVSEDVKVCQVGYLPHESKFAMLTSEPNGLVAVCRLPDGSVAMTAQAGQLIDDPMSGDRIYWVDFTRLDQHGDYYLDVPGIGRSHVFQIGPTVFDRPLRRAMRAFYGNRCGCAVDLSPDFPEYRYPACHTAPVEYDVSSGKSGMVECSGGWHDAGDYGRYIVNSGITCGQLLWAYELNEEKLNGLKLDIPESGGPLPDFLAEVKWNLDWMLKMQDASDGGVWHKATTRQFARFVMPQDDLALTVIVGTGEAPWKVTTATADFAAVMAIASRSYSRFDELFAKRCLAAAESAWEWCSEHPDSTFIDNPAGIRTGGYGDNDPSDEILWAAAELHRSTGKSEYGSYFLCNHSKWRPLIQGDRPQVWAHVEHMAMYTYALTEAKTVDEATRAAIIAASVAAADEIVVRCENDGYRIPMLAGNYNWGSNAVVANYGLMLLMANRFRPSSTFFDAAMDCLHYLLGRNTFNTSFVTHLGSRWAMNPHHRPSGADGIEQPWPGMLMGGPNARGVDPPATQWLDEKPRADLNEMAINWNAPLVFLLAEAATL